MKQPHGNKGNRNAAKPTDKKLSERLNLIVHKGIKARIRKASGGMVSPWLRDAIREKLEGGK